MHRRLLWPSLAACLAVLLAVWTVLAAAPLYSPTHLPNDPYIAQQWGLGDAFGIRATEAWTMTTGGDITIAVLDSGFDLSHPDLVDRWQNAYNFLETGDPTTDAWTDNYGTAIAGIIAATGNNQQGISGVTWRTRLIPLRVVSRDSTTGAPTRFPNTAALIVNALDYAAQHGARIAVFGFSMRNLTETEQDQIQAAINRLQDPLMGGNMVIIAPVGERPDAVPYPAALDGVIGVTGIMTDGLALQIRSTGQLVVPQGSFVDLAAPAQDILTTTWNPGGDPRHTFSTLALGTEYAAAFTAGAAALVLSLDPSLPTFEVERILRASATDLGDSGPDQLYGAGLVNALGAIRRTRHLLFVRPNSVTLSPEIGASATLTNAYTLAASWRIVDAPPWLTVDPPTDGVASSTTRVVLARVPSCEEMSTAEPLMLASELPLSYGPVEVRVQVTGICASGGPTPTPRPSTPVPTLTPTATLVAPDLRYQLFLPHVVRGCKGGVCPR